ncbi:MJ0042-type zinc finger domain-containing protein [Bosea sp. CER48]|uniref:MJ0042-type zinc finger domain-containing protein n=1 Tax=Bosea sp. CER48 TaxID=3377035 RepID=UPI003809D9DC
MLIVCPTCASQYELDAAKLGPEGRKVRCASCKNAWHVDPVATLPEPPSAEETQAELAEELARSAAIAAEISALTAESAEKAAAAEIEAEPAREVAPDAGRRKRGAVKGRVSRPASSRGRNARVPAVAALLGLALLGLIVWQRQAVVRAAPQLAGVFEMAGLPVNVRGLTLTAIESGLVDDGANRFLVVEGDVTNVSRSKAPVPLIEVAVRDAAGATLYTWTAEPPRASLEPTELVRFRARLASPPESGRSVRVRFTSATTTANIASTR